MVSGSEDGTIKLWNVQAGECLQTLSSSRPYAGMNITGVRGLTKEQKEALKELGATKAYQMLLMRAVRMKRLRYGRSVQRRVWSDLLTAVFVQEAFNHTRNGSASHD